MIMTDDDHAVRPDHEAAVERIMAAALELPLARASTLAHWRDVLREAIREELAAAQRDGYVRALEEYNAHYGGERHTGMHGAFINVTIKEALKGNWLDEAREAT